MKLLQIFKSKKSGKSAPSISKSNDFAGDNSQAFINHLLKNEQYNITASQAVNYYNRCAPLNTAIEWIAIEGANIRPLLFDTVKEEFIADHPVLDLLQNPNAAMPYKEFMQSIMIFYLLTGNSYIIAGGPIDKEPVTLDMTPPQTVTIQIGDNGYPDTFTIITSYDSSVYKRALKDKKFRYFRNGQFELYQIKNFNPDTTNFRLVGKSPLNPIYHEIEQYLASSVHNLSLLKRGASITGIFKHDSTLSDDGFRRLRNQIDIWMSGETNAGRAFLAEDGLDFESTGSTNKDMDFLLLKENVTTAIYNKLKIPLPLIAKETMTMGNFDAAKLEMYDRAVLPLINRIFDELTYFLLPRYKNSENLIFSYDEGKIPALEPRRNANVQALKDTSVVSTNELRARLNLDPKEGGDPLYQPSTQVPFTED